MTDKKKGTGLRIKKLNEEKLKQVSGGMLCKCPDCGCYTYNPCTGICFHCFYRPCNHR